MGRIVYILALLAGCADSPEARVPEAPHLTIFAAASLTEALPAVAARWRDVGSTCDEGCPDTTDLAATTFSFDSSSRIAAQINAGAPADIVVTADREWMDDLASHGRIDPQTRVEVAGNELVVVVSARLAGATYADPPALAATPPERLALAGETVPAGRYAGAALRATGIADALAPRIVRGDSVRSALAYVARGEADAAIVYRTDARAEPRVRVAYAFPPSSHPPITYPAAIVRRDDPEAAARRRAATSFLHFCTSEVGHAVFAAYGFTAPP
jgi:molybdate transport system substrate-binding protein